MSTFNGDGGPGGPFLTGASLAAETNVTRGEERRLKAGCSQDWLPHKSSIAATKTGVASRGRRINNPPDPEGTPGNLPHKAGTI